MTATPRLAHLGTPRPPAPVHARTDLGRLAPRTLYIIVTPRLYVDAGGRRRANVPQEVSGQMDERVGACNPEALADYAREQALRRRLEVLVKREMQGVDVRWIEQAFSPLGPRTHIAAVRRRMAEAEARGVPATELGAAKHKRTYYLTPESLAEELGRRPMRKTAPAANDTDAEESAYADFMARSSSRGR